jgi:hypothetical protein
MLDWSPQLVPCSTCEGIAIAGVLTTDSGIQALYIFYVSVARAVGSEKQ